MSKKQQSYISWIVLSCIIIFGLVVPWLFPGFTDLAEALWRERGNDFLIVANCSASILIIAQIFAVRLNVRDGLTIPQIFILLLTLPIVLALASIPIRTIFGLYPVHDESETALNVFLCILLYMIRRYWTHVVQLFSK